MSILDNHYLVCYIIGMGGHKTKIDLEQLFIELLDMNTHKSIFKVAKKALTIRGYWKNHKRGIPNYGWKNKKSIQE
jgi:hypothetical protein